METEEGKKEILNEILKLRTFLEDRFDEVNGSLRELDQRIENLEKTEIEEPQKESTGESEKYKPISQIVDGDADDWSFGDESNKQEDSWSDGFSFGNDSSGGFGCSSKDPNAPKEKKKRFKVTLLGDGNVGKSYFIKNLKGPEHIEKEEKYNPTIGVEVHPVSFPCNDGETYFLNFWDTAGQERFGGLRDGYYIMSDAGLFFWDPTVKGSFSSMEMFINDYVNVVGENNCFGIVTNQTNVHKRKLEPQKGEGKDGETKDDDEEEICDIQSLRSSFKKTLGDIPVFDVKLDEMNPSVFNLCLGMLRRLTGNNSLEFRKV